ncbi:S41 family peptidase [Paraglaciecola aquimarina]|uniref:S41 family peptidase n=1 Tax=Paraglaciecola algarum TaxID=3050085 RepID=A0ABS9DAK7_9ALTE|nr:S41 family peptidase [Paraglaciecola sp. G1-23]MCF2949427.1 S41 family peptidase [Paraglaciecola sp. G1-23]
MKFLLVFFTAFLTVSLLSACQNNNPTQGDVQPYPILLDDPLLCADQTVKNQTLIDYLRQWYLWEDEIPSQLVAEQFLTLSDLLEEIKSSTNLDRWSEVMSAQQYADNFLNSSAASYGFKIGFNTARDALLVFDVYPQSAANLVGLKRGDRITHVNGLPVYKLQNSVLLQALITPGETGENSGISISWINAKGIQHQNFIQRTYIETNAIRYQTIFTLNQQKIGYFVYDSFDQPSSEQLNTLINEFISQDIEQLIVDLRYNPGGFGHIANQLASQIAGENVRGEIFNHLKLNNIQSQQSQVSRPFILENGQNTLHLSEVTVLTTKRTASASEMFINALTPHIKVNIIGQQTAGKPIGMKVVGICDQVIFAATQQNLNSQMQGDYFDGLAADCPAIDEFSSDWGDSQNDNILQKALHFVEHGQCD